MASFVFYKLDNTQSERPCAQIYDQQFTLDNYAVQWNENGHVLVERDDNQLKIRHADDRFNDGKIIFQWNFDKESISFCRHWPGNTSLYFSPKSSCLVSTYLSTYAKLEANMKPQPKLASPDIFYTLDLNRLVLSEESVSSIDNHTIREPLETIAAQFKHLMHEFVQQFSNDTMLLLSGGVDSAAIACAAKDEKLPCMTWALQQAEEYRTSLPDVEAAKSVATHLSLEHFVLEIDEQQLGNDIHAAVLLSEIKRGTLIDDIVVYIQVAQYLKRNGFKSVLIGEAADDAFGCMTMNLRYLQNDELLQKLRSDVLVGAPADYAAISKVFAYYGIEVVDPYLSLDIAKIGANIPLNMRITEDNVIKPIIRTAFEKQLPMDIINRKKEVSRDVSGIKEAMLEYFGNAPNRFHDMYKRLFIEKGAHIEQQRVLDYLNEWQA